VTKPKGERKKSDHIPAPSSPTAEQLRLQAYNLVVERAELASVRLIHLKFDRGADLEKPKGRSKASAFFDVSPADHGFDPETGYAILKLNCSAGAKRGKIKLVDCNAIFVVMYQGLQGCDQLAVSRFLVRVGRFAGYPYFRSLFAVLTWNAETGMPPLPVLREAPMKRKGTESEAILRAPKQTTKQIEKV
jgi:hypothetical protein